MSEHVDTRPIMVFDLNHRMGVDLNSQEYFEFVDACRQKLVDNPSIWIKIGGRDAKEVSSVREIRDVVTGRRHTFDRSRDMLREWALFLCLVT